MATFELPFYVFVAGTKKSGKDHLCDTLVATAGYKKLHIADSANRRICADMGIDFETDWLPHKERYRAELQRRALLARAENPNVLTDALKAHLQADLTQPYAITGVRFENEVELGREIGALTLRVVLPDVQRQARFVAAGEDLALFDDPFESDIPILSVDADIAGDIRADWQPYVVAHLWSDTQQGYTLPPLVWECFMSIAATVPFSAFVAGRDLDD